MFQYIRDNPPLIKWMASTRQEFHKQLTPLLKTEYLFVYHAYKAHNNNKEIYTYTRK